MNSQVIDKNFARGETKREELNRYNPLCRGYRFTAGLVRTESEERARQIYADSVELPSQRTTPFLERIFDYLFN